MKFHKYCPSNTKPSPERYFERNRKMVVEADRIVAFNKKIRSGTTYTINYAKKIGKSVKVFDGGEGLTPNDRALVYCPKCIQMTNHLNGTCLKCKFLE